MSFQRMMLWSVAAALATCVPGSSAFGATITNVATFSLPGFSTGSVGPVGNTPVPNNDDDPGASPNVIPCSVFLNSPGRLETEFILTASGGTTEYRFTQSFVNTINAPWKGFRFELGFGTGDDFVLADAGSLLRFDTLNGQSTATSPVFTLAAQQPQELDWTVATPPFLAAFTFAIDVPDGLDLVNASGLNRFTLRQTPIADAPVPEPATFGLAAVALLGIVVSRRF